MRSNQQQNTLTEKISQAVDLMKLSMNVEDWNENRKIVKRTFTGNQKEWMELWYEIEGKTLIVDILGKDATKVYRDNPGYGVNANHIPKPIAAELQPVEQTNKYDKFFKG